MLCGVPMLPRAPWAVGKHACPYVENNNKSPGPATFAIHPYPLCVDGGPSADVTPADLSFCFGTETKEPVSYDVGQVSR